jgi:putative SOS response-associated peptidase YedK
MCGRYTVAVDPQLLAERFNVALPDDVEPRYNVAPSQPVMTVTQRSAGRELLIARWGLVPHWAKEPKAGFKMINARAETLAEKSTYRQLLTRGRCLILADGFYEWRLDPDGKKRPVRYALEDGSPFGFAGLWTIWRDPESKEPLFTCTIVTTSANALVAPVHDRMPVVLAEPGAWEAWLDPALDGGAVAPLLAPLPAAGLEVAPANPVLNHPDHEGPDCLAVA